MKVISQIGKFDGTNLTNQEEIGALDRNIFITDVNGNVINTLHNKIANLDSQTIDLNNLIYEDEEKNNIYFKNSDSLIPNAQINRNGTLYIKKINIANSDISNTILEMEGLSNKNLFCWETNTENGTTIDYKYGLKNYYKNNLNEWVASSDFIWNINYLDNESFYINKPTHIKNGNLYIDRNDTVSPRIQILCPKQGTTDSESNITLGFRIVIDKTSNSLVDSNDSTEKVKTIRFQYANYENNNEQSWSNFMFKNYHLNTVFFPEGRICIGNNTLENGCSLHLRSNGYLFGLHNSTYNSNDINLNSPNGNFGLYKWSVGQNDPNTGWILRYNNGNNQLITNRSFKIHNNNFEIGQYDSSNSSFTPYISMSVSNNASHISLVNGHINSNTIDCNVIYPVMTGSNYRKQDSITLNSGECRIYVPTGMENNEITYGIRGIIGTYINSIDEEYINGQGQTQTIPSWRRIVSMYTDKDINQRSRLRVVANWGGSGQYSYETKTVFSDESDIRLKENIEDTTETGLDLINQIQMRQFDWKDSHFHQKIGFVADELEQLDSNLSAGGGYDSEGNFDTKVVNTFYLQGYEVKAIQELSQQVNTLKQQIEELKVLLKNK